VVHVAPPHGFCSFVCHRHSCLLFWELGALPFSNVQMTYQKCQPAISSLITCSHYMVLLITFGHEGSHSFTTSTVVDRIYVGSSPGSNIFSIQDCSEGAALFWSGFAFWRRAEGMVVWLTMEAMSSRLKDLILPLNTTILSSVEAEWLVLCATHSVFTFLLAGAPPLRIQHFGSLKRGVIPDACGSRCFGVNLADALKSVFVRVRAS